MRLNSHAAAPRGCGSIFAMIKETSREHVNFGGPRSLPGEFGAGFALIILLGLALRLYGLGAQELRYGEAVAYLTSAAGSVSLDPQFHSGHPPLYHHAIHLWTRLHESVWFARLFEVLCGIGVIAAVHALAMRAAGRKAALFAAFVQAASPFAIYHSREAGAEVFAQLLTVISLLALERYLATGHTRAAFAALTAQLLAVFTSYAALPLIPAMLTAVYVGRNSQRGIWGEWLALQGLFILPAALWLYAVFEGRIVAGIDSMNSWTPGVSFQALLNGLNTPVYGYFTQNLPAWLLAPPIIVLAAAGLASAAGWRLAIYYFLPLIALAVFADMGGQMLSSQLLVFTPALAVLAGTGFAALNFAPFRAGVALWVAAGFLAGAAGYYANDRQAAVPGAFRKEFSLAAAFLSPRLRAGETLYHAGRRSTAPMAALRFGGWRQRWLTVETSPNEIAAYEAERLAGAGMPVPFNGEPEFPAWVLYSSGNPNPYRDVEIAALRRRIEHSAAPAEGARFDGIDLIRYIPYETSRLDALEDESGGMRLFVDRATGGQFPANYPMLRPAFAGTVLRLSSGGALELSTAYPDAELTLTVVEGYPLFPAAGPDAGFVPAADGYANSFCFEATVSPERAATVVLSTTAPAGNYRLFARVLHGAQNAALQAFAAQRGVTEKPVIPGVARPGWEWVNLGTASYDGLNPFSIRATAPGGQTAVAALQSFFLIPAEGGKLHRKNFVLHKGEQFRLDVLTRGLPVAVFVTDDARGEMLTATLAR